MKRIEKVESLVNLEIKRENGENFSFGMDEILEISNVNVNGKHYTSLKLANGFDVIYRSTLQCTFYEVIEENEVACSLEEEPTIDTKTFDLNEQEKTKVHNFYKIKFKDLRSFENDENLFFGLTDYENNLYIPMGKGEDDTEECIVLNEKSLDPIVTEVKVIDNMICDLSREKRKFDDSNYTLEARCDERTYLMNKQNCDAVIKFNLNGRSVTGFVDGENVIAPILSSTNFFNVLSIKVLNISECNEIKYLYKKYKKIKKTKGITDIDYTDMFSYLSF